MTNSDVQPIKTALMPKDWKGNKHEKDPSEIQVWWLYQIN